MAISRSIVDAVRSLDPPGRFLDKDPDTGLWFDIGHKKAVEKTSQALRDGAATLRKQLSADLGDPDFLNAVFNEDEKAQSTGDEEKQKAAEDGKSASEMAGETEKESKVNTSEKSKPVKVRSRDLEGLSV
jgi:hypothetical protein